MPRPGLRGNVLCRQNLRRINFSCEVEADDPAENALRPGRVLFSNCGPNLKVGHQQRRLRQVPVPPASLPATSQRQGFVGNGATLRPCGAWRSGCGCPTAAEPMTAATRTTVMRVTVHICVRLRTKLSEATSIRSGRPPVGEMARFPAAANMATAAHDWVFLVDRGSVASVDDVLLKSPGRKTFSGQPSHPRQC